MHVTPFRGKDYGTVKCAQCGPRLAMVLRLPKRAAKRGGAYTTRLGGMLCQRDRSSGRVSSFPPNGAGYGLIGG